ncbi:hypothetical protein H4R33_001622 [Dimargaris cristalligena]|uniref:Galactose oxidase n=1 Tax=Dimargaris cristalligena TaxID=215637 RepID=A0A4P9ZVJ4_9FUNG|nr:hypothetical protein H4R33_001622 [Dimargaris cristalligena]RKP37624.1 hypothetical protein BJ085DRAFT_38213 [Dimargaris cristalligena]|eukprot:RKP37624.1 hypothetical protein BJ085DRAFT_38213 [Dimargaris cristalligena]
MLARNEMNASPSLGGTGPVSVAPLKPEPTLSLNTRQLSKKGSAPAPVPAMYWSRVKTYGTGPKKVRSHTMNVIGDYIYIFGGWDNRCCYSEVFVFDSDSMHWSVAKAAGDIPPPCRAHSSTVIDRKLYVFGGGDGPNYFSELYIFDADTLLWSKPKVSGEAPGPRRTHTSFAYDGALYLFGGGDGTRPLNDIYKLTITPHAPRVPTGNSSTAGPIRSHSYNSTIGHNQHTPAATNGSLDAPTFTYHWSRLNTEGTPPRARGYHTNNIIQDKLLVYGGSDGNTCFDDIHILHLPTLTWTQVDCQPPIVRLAHTATQVGSYLFVIGGHDGNQYSNEILLLNLVTMNWEIRRVYGAHPTGRAYHAAVLHDSRLFLHGGFDGQSVVSDLYVLDLSGYAYLPQVTDFELALLR